MEQQLPIYIDVFLSPLRDSQLAQVLFVATVILMALDILFGVGCALANKEFSSQKMREGIGHKAAGFGLIAVSIIVDGMLMGGVDLPISIPVLEAVFSYLTLMEVGSLLETFAKLNPELHDSAVFKLLESVTDKENE